MLILRDYQESLLAKTRELLRQGKRSILIQSATGSGKTVLVAHILAGCRAKGWPCWFVVHRSELVSQSVETLTQSAAIPVGVAAAGHPLNPWELVQVCMVQSLRSRIKRMARPRLIVWDEVHHIAAGSWSKIHAQFPDAIHIGVTATPQRLDGTGLGAWFQELVTGPSVRELIERGYLSKYRMFGARTLDLSGIHTQAGDYNKKELGVALQGSAVVGDAVAEYQKHATGKRAIVFTWSIESSKEVTEKFRTAGAPSAHVDGNTPDAERLRLMREFKAGTLRVLSNVDLFGEGVDVPAIEAVFLLRPTQSTGLYLQQVGRALRPGKDAALIFDHAGNRIRHGLPDDDRRWSLSGNKPCAGEYVPPQKQCMKCYSIQSAAVELCRNCGAAFPKKPREVEVESGELAEITEADIQELKRHQRIQQGQADSFEALLKIEKERKFKPGWARHVFEARLAKQNRIPAMFAGGETR